MSVYIIIKVNIVEPVNTIVQNQTQNYLVRMGVLATPAKPTVLLNQKPNHCTRQGVHFFKTASLARRYINHLAGFLSRTYGTRQGARMIEVCVNNVICLAADRQTPGRPVCVEKPR